MDQVLYIHFWKYISAQVYVSMYQLVNSYENKETQTKKSLLFLSVFHNLYTVLGVVAGSYLYWFWAAAGLAVSP